MEEISPTTPRFLNRSLIQSTMNYTMLVTQCIINCMAKELALLLAIFTPEEEVQEKLWATGVISYLNPKALQRALFF